MDATQEWEIWRDAQASRRRRESRKFREVMFLTSIPFWCIILVALLTSFMD